VSTNDIWTFKYAPTSFDEIILSPDIKPILKKVIKEKPNIMLVGNAGVGKGTFTDIFLNETGLDYIKLNCSDETSVQDIRDKVKTFATSLGMTGMKIVVLNESDYISINGQAMLRDLMESVHKITRFIFQCNYKNKIIPEIHSRCQVIEISSPPIKDIGLHVLKILKAEGIKIKNKTIIGDTIKKFYPDIRRIINTLQLNTVNKTLGDFDLESSNETYDKIFEYMKNGDLDNIRKTLRSESVNYPELYQHLFDMAGDFKSPGDAIIEIGEYLFRSSLVAIQEINFITMVVSMMKRGII
jgi:DNA polymerase III delta prime subunit